MENISISQPNIHDCIKESIENITSIYEKYANDEYMISKIHTYVSNQLPNIIDNIKYTHDQRVLRIEELTTEQDAFIHSFLNDNQYFFIAATDRFFYYNGIHYQVISEDDILHNVLTTITRGKNLMSWKQRTKMNIMKRIKESSLLKSIPESKTIQNVIDALYPAIFSTRNEAKYFLTILGDNINKKNTHLIHYIQSSSRQFLKELNYVCQYLIGVGLAQTFKNKYHEHSYDDCRLVNINETVRHEHVWNKLIHNLPLDLICVASHYSLRFGSSDEFIINSNIDSELKNSVFYVKNMKPDVLVTQFITEYLDIDLSDNHIQVISGNSNRSPQITWKNMQYLWKHFLDMKKLPPIMFLNTFKSILQDKLSKYYVEDIDSFVGICSKHLPAIQKFLHFWDETIILDNTELDFEIEEIVTLFKQWCNTNNAGTTTLNDKQIIDVIQYFFTDIDIERDKYISGIRCKLWDKQLDIQVALNSLKDSLRSKIDNNGVKSPSLIQPISIYDTYIHYCKFYSTNSHHIVSKTYFEKYIYDNFEEDIIDNKYLSVDWYIL